MSGNEATNAEVVLWLKSRFASFNQRGLVTRAQADAYNSAHPDRPYLGPTKNTAPWSNANQRSREYVAKLNSEAGRRAACKRWHGPSCGCWSRGSDS